MTGVYCDKMTEVTITRFSQKSRVLTFSTVSLMEKFEGGTLDRGELKLGWVVFDFAMLYLGNGAR